MTKLLDLPKDSHFVKLSETLKPSDINQIFLEIPQGNFMRDTGRIKLDSSIEGNII